MKNKLKNYLMRECVLLGDILMQTREIKKSIIVDDVEYASRLFSGRGRNLDEVNPLHSAVVEIFERGKGDEVADIDNEKLREKAMTLLQEITSLDNEISEMLSTGLAAVKEDHKKTKNIRILKKSYSHQKGSIPSLFDKKT